MKTKTAQWEKVNNLLYPVAPNDNDDDGMPLSNDVDKTADWVSNNEAIGPSTPKRA